MARHAEPALTLFFGEDSLTATLRLGEEFVEARTWSFRHLQRSEFVTFRDNFIDLLKMERASMKGMNNKEIFDKYLDLLSRGIESMCEQAGQRVTLIQRSEIPRVPIMTPA
jgi:hypothetical protein